jgi:hypothetical protein
VKAWVDEMPEELLSGQFPRTPPIFINNDLINSFFRQQVMRQQEVFMAATALQRDDLKPEVREQVLDMTFPQRFDKCNASWGKPCVFRLLCHGNVNDPLSSGFELRDVSHREAYKELVGD